MFVALPLIRTLKGVGAYQDFYDYKTQDSFRVCHLVWIIFD